MDGQSHWLDFAVVFGGGFLVLAVLVVLGIRRAYRKRKMAFVCPYRHAEVEVTAVQNEQTGYWVDVKRCSAFSPSDAVTCQKACRNDMNAGRLHSVR